ncbi:MAG TPA: creatininase family protein [Streptosporangiaceae bacterium]|nr:creatininase family protein [Streptosporangiaceae bacterium]
MTTAVPSPRFAEMTDPEIAEALARNPRVILPMGSVEQHRPHLPTGTDFFDIGSSLAQHGCREFVILNWHEGNTPSLALVAERLHRELALVVVVQACYVAEDQFGAHAGGLTHGGTIEAWSVLSCRPELVHLERAASPSPTAESVPGGTGK